MEDLIRQQDKDIDVYYKKLINLKKQADPTCDFYSMSIDVLSLSTRSWNCLRRAGIKTVKDLMDCKEIHKVRNLGQSSAQEILDKLKILIAANREVIKVIDDNVTVTNAAKMT